MGKKSKRKTAAVEAEPPPDPANVAYASMPLWKVKPSLKQFQLAMSNKEKDVYQDNVRFLHALKAHEWPLAERLLEEGADVYARTGDKGFTSLHHVVVEKDFKAFHWLMVARKARGDTPEGLRVTADDGATLLLLAAAQGMQAMVESLCQDGAAGDIEVPNDSGHTPLYMAVQGGHAHLVSWFATQQYAPVSFSSRAARAPVAPSAGGRRSGGGGGGGGGSSGLAPAKEKYDLLFVACAEGHLEVAQALLPRVPPAEAHRPQWNGATPLSIACQRGFQRLVRWLLASAAASTAKAMAKAATANSEYSADSANSVDSDGTDGGAKSATTTTTTAAAAATTTTTTTTTTNNNNGGGGDGDGGGTQTLPLEGVHGGDPLAREAAAHAPDSRAMLRILDTPSEELLLVHEGGSESSKKKKLLAGGGGSGGGGGGGAARDPAAALPSAVGSLSLGGGATGQPEKAAEQGSSDADMSPEAQYSLGAMHERGEGGVEQSDSTAMRWYGRAAAQGHAGAKEGITRILAGASAKRKSSKASKASKAAGAAGATPPTTPPPPANGGGAMGDAMGGAGAAPPPLPTNPASS